MTPHTSQPSVWLLVGLLAFQIHMWFKLFYKSLSWKTGGIATLGHSDKNFILLVKPGGIAYRSPGAVGFCH